MKLRRRDVGCLAAGTLVYGGVMVAAAITAHATVRRLPLAAAGTLIVAIGGALVAWYRRIGTARAPERSLPSDALPGPQYGAGLGATTPVTRVVIVGDTAHLGTLGEQLLERAAAQIAKAPRFPLARDVVISTLHTDQLPPPRHDAVQPFVWALQQRFGLRGSRWQADFHDALGTSFLVVYLE